MRYNRSYDRRPVWGGFSANMMVNKIILVSVIVFVVQQIFIRPPALYEFQRFFGLVPRDVVEKLHFWQPFTYMFLHGGFMHLFFNMLITWFFGSVLESTWGGQRFLKYYIACGLGGAAFSFIFAFDGPPIVGASGAIFGLYLAYGVLFPNNFVYIYFLFPVSAKYFVMILASVQMIHGISGPSGIAYFAHLGGMATGAIFFRREIMNMRFWTGTRRRWGNYHRTRHEEWDRQESVKIDSILDKIVSKGYENLTTTEKRILENYSRKQKEDSE